MFKKVWEYKKFRFLCVGVFNTSIDFIILNTLVFSAKFPKWLANVISVSIAASISYFLNHHIVFRQPHSTSFKGYLKFFGVTAVGVIVIQTAIIYITQPLYVDIIKHVHFITKIGHRNGLSLNLAKATAVLCGMVWNYGLYNHFVFKRHHKDDQVDSVI